MKPAAGRPAAGSAARPKRTSGAGRAAVRVGGRRVTRGAKREGAGRGRIVTIRGSLASPARRKRGQRVQERTADLTLGVVLLHEQGRRQRLVRLRGRRGRAGGGAAARVRQATAVSRVDADG